MAFKVRPRRNGKFQACVEAPGFPPGCGTFPDAASARAWAIATNTTVLSGGFLPLKPKARALVKVVLAEYETSELPTQASAKSSRSRIKTLVRLLGDVTLADFTVEVLEAFKRIRMGSAQSGQGPEPGTVARDALSVEGAGQTTRSGGRTREGNGLQSKLPARGALLQRAVRAGASLRTPVSYGDPAPVAKLDT